MKSIAEDFPCNFGRLHGKPVKTETMELAITANMRGLGYGG